MSDSNAKNTQDTGSRDRSSVWTWIGIGIGTGLVVTVIAGLGYQYLESRRRSRDPRAEKVQDLLEQAEKLLAQGRKSHLTKRKEESPRSIAPDKDSSN